MGIESREMQQRIETSQLDIGDDNSEGSVARARPLDLFLADRYETRARDGYSCALSYLEEKSLFTLNQDSMSRGTNTFAASIRRQMSLTPNRFIMRPGNNQPLLPVARNGNNNASHHDRIPLFGL